MTRGLSRTIDQVAPSATLSLREEVVSLEKEYGFSILDLSAGQPDVGPSQDVEEALAAGAQYHAYGPVQGDLDLRKAVSRVIREEPGLEYDVKDISIGVGAKGCLDVVLRVLLNPGDRVGIMAPFWVTYLECVKIAHGVPCTLLPDAELRPALDKLRGEIEANGIKVLLYSSPCNPSGVVYTREELEQLARIARDMDLWVISDEIYKEFLFDGRRHESIATLDGMRERTILIDGPSKRFGVPGWRVGYAAGPGPVMRAVAKTQSHTTSASRPVQYAITVAYGSKQAREATEVMRRRYEKNRDLFADGLRNIEGVRCVRPEGAFYIFPSFEPLFGQRYEFAGSEHTVGDSVELRNFLLRKAHVAGVEGEPFGMDGHIRFCLATGEDVCLRALDGIRQAVSELH
jgi:aspartate aminotransferase